MVGYTYFEYVIVDSSRIGNDGSFSFGDFYNRGRLSESAGLEGAARFGRDRDLEEFGRVGAEGSGIGRGVVGFVVTRRIVVGVGGIREGVRTRSEFFYSDRDVGIVFRKFRV